MFWLPSDAPQSPTVDMLVEPDRTLRTRSRPAKDAPVVLHPRVVTGTGGGPDKTIINSPQFLSELGYRGLCAYMHPPEDEVFQELERRAKLVDADLISVPDRGAWDLSIVRRYVQICREHNVRIWHGHDYKSNAIGLLVRRFHPMKLVSTVHGWGVTGGRAPLYYKIDRACLRRYDKVVCVSNDLLDQCLAAGVSPKKLVLIENAIDVDAYQPTKDRATAKQTLGISPSRLVIGSVARLSAEKSFDALIKTVDDLIETGLDVTLVIAGDGPERPALEPLIQQLGREDHIRLLGHVGDPRPVFEAMDVFVLNSLCEGLPNVLLESMAMGVPAVCTNVGGVAGVLTHEQNGLLISPGAPDELFVSLNRLLHNEALRNDLATAGRQTIESDYSFRIRMQKMAEVYESVECVGSMPPVEFATRLHRRSDAPQTASTVTVAPAINFREWDQYLVSKGVDGFHSRSQWLNVLERGLHHEPISLQATRGGKVTGVLALAHIQSRLFGKFMVSLPYINSSGIVADDDQSATALIERAIQIADALDVRFLELRNETEFRHDKLTTAANGKVHMRLALPDTVDAMWSSIKSKVRSQIRKAQRNDDLTMHWGGLDLLDEFYDIFCRNMRDLGTPPFSRDLFRALVDVFEDAAEFCTVRLDGRPIAAGLLIHGPGSTEVPSASSLREFNSTNANMLMYWHLLARTIERGQQTFDFGRSTLNAGTFNFKKQWGAEPHPAVWQYYVREGSAKDMRPDNGKFGLMIRAWQKLPVWVTRLIGPTIVRGIP